jgi:hypothetical protein
MGNEKFTFNVFSFYLEKNKALVGLNFKNNMVLLQGLMLGVEFSLFRKLNA